MKAVWFFPVGIAVGALLTWGMLSGPMRGRAGEAPLVRAVAASVGTGAPSPPDGVDAPPALPRTAAPADELELPAEKQIRYWLAAATTYGLTRKKARFLDALEGAIAAGAEVEPVTQAISSLEPWGERAGVLKELMRRHPEMEWNSWTLANLYQLAGEGKAAFDLLAEKLKDPPDDPNSLITRLIELDPERAASLLAEVADREDWSGRILLLIAEKLIEQGRNVLGMPFLLASLDKMPGGAEALRLLGTIDPAAALGRALRAVEANPTDADAWALLARMRLDAGDQAGSFAAYSIAARNESDEDTRRGYLSGMLATDPAAALPVIQELLADGGDEDLGLLGRALIANGHRDRAFDIFSRAHEADPTDSEWLHRLVSADCALAIRRFEEALARDPDTENDELIGVFATALLRAGRTEEAYAQFLRALKIDASDWEWMQGVARANPTKAAELLEARRREEPDDGTLAGALADAYSRMGRTAEAIRLYEFAIEQGDGKHRWMGGLAATEPARGLPMIREALRESPEDEELWGALGMAYARLGQVEEARKAFDRALTIDSEDWEWAFYRSELD